MLTLKITKPKPVNLVFMHPAIFIPSWVILGALFALQELLNLRRWGYDIGTGIEFVSWGVEFLVLGVLCWLMWRFLLPFILKANLVQMLTLGLPLSIAFGAVKEMIWVLFFPNVPLDRPHMPYWTRFEFHWKAQFIDSLIIFWCAFFLFRGIDYYQRFREKEKVAAQLEVQLANATLGCFAHAAQSAFPLQRHEQHLQPDAHRCGCGRYHA